MANNNKSTVGKAPKIRKVKANDLTTDIRVQRDLDPRRVRNIIAQFDINAIGTLCVSERDNGEMVVIDGGHRTAALLQTDNGDTLVNAEIYTGLSLADEAFLFRVRNNTQKVGFLDLFRVRLIEQEKVAVAVANLADKYGWVVSGAHEGSEKPVLHSVKKLEEIYRRDEELADSVMEVTTKAWYYNPDSVDYRILDGLAKFLSKYWEMVDSNDLAVKLANVPGGPNALIGRSQSFREMLNCTSGMAMAELITDAYNKGRRHNGSRLPSWRS